MSTSNDSRCTDIDENLRFKPLPTQLIVNNYIEGEDSYSYEVYLRDYINSSSYFLKLSNGEKYIEPLSEAHGESDAISNKYCIDFKLMVGESKMEASSILSDGIYKYSDGFYGFGEPRSKSKKQMKYSRICQALRYKSLEDLERIKAKEHRNFIEHDIARFLEKLCVQKNILLFFPYEFYYDNPPEESKAFISISEALFHDLKTCIQYRKLYAKDFDTYLATVYENRMLFFNLSESEFKLVDTVNLSSSKLFIHLYNISQWF